MNVLTLEELISRVQIPEKTIKEWEKRQLFHPAGFKDDDIPLYSEQTAERIKTVQSFVDMGYSLDEIQKIMKKIGMPKKIAAGKEKKHLGQFLTVGNLSDRVGVSPRTIKHWEDKGIIEPDTRSEGGFRLYSEDYIYICELVRDLQLFGYSLEEIKIKSDYFRDFLDLQDNWQSIPKKEVARKLKSMLKEIDQVFERTAQLRKGMQRCEDLLKKKKKEIISIKSQNDRRTATRGGEKNV